MVPALERVSGWLTCPNCTGQLSLGDRALTCARGHSFDIAKQGYVNLMGKAAPKSADTTQMVAARARFLGAGHYDPLMDAVVRRVSGNRLLEVGAGPGIYLARALDENPSAAGLATDVSPAAAKAAAKRHDRMAAIVSDTWTALPIRSSAVDALMCIFAPRNPAEFWRVLRPGGLLLVVTPAPDHLAKLREDLGLLGLAEDKLSTLQRSLNGFAPIATNRTTWTLNRLITDEGVGGCSARRAG